MDEERCVPAHEENDVTPDGLAEDDDMLPEYEFGYSKGVRGKYYRRLKEEGSNLVLLEPDVAKAFRSSDAVSQALRSLLELCETTRRLTSRSSVSKL